MATFFQFAHPYAFIASASILICILIIRYKWYQPHVYCYPLTHFLKLQKKQASSFYTTFFFWLRLIALIFMTILIGKPQFVDSKSKTTVDGIDIVLALDVSGSMNCFDDPSDRTSRLAIAKREALDFITKRDNDAIGLVIFGKHAITRCPLTLDKNILKEIISKLEIGQPSQDMPQSTMLSQGIASALRRLQMSKSKSKIIVLLTDGEPSPGDLNPNDIIKIAKELSVKIYTIGIGGDDGGFNVDPIFGLCRVQAPLNKALLKKIAQETRGRAFEAKNAQDLKKIYNIIDQLEKHSYETEIYNKYHDYFMPILWCTIWLIFIELFMATWIWFII